MRTAFVTAAAFGLSVVGAYACPAHDTHAGADEKLTVASVTDHASPMSTPEVAADEERMAKPATPDEAK